MKFYSPPGGKKSRTKKTGNYIYFFLFLLITPFTSFGTHISGGEITYKWISGNTFEITLTLYRDCAGVAAPTSPNVTYKSASCHKNLNITLNPKPGTGQEITHPCSTAVTTCNGGSSTGIQKYEYTALVTLPSNCTDWVFGYSICCRNCAITTLNFNGCANAPATYVEATLNNQNAPTNSSPVFTNIPITFICIGQQFNYNHGAYDSDGDSIVYSLIPPRSASGTNVAFQPGYSANQPISSSPPLSLNTSNGDITIRPTAIEVGVMAVLVSEYRNGVLIGSVVRDMQVYTQTCNNILPTASGINGTNNYSITACPGNPLNINILSADGNAGQIVSMSWNGGIHGATFTTTGNPYPTGHLSWTPTHADARAQPYSFTVTVNDNNCPSFGFQTYSYSIIVPDISVTATSTNSLCISPGTGTATAVASGIPPFNYSWNPGGSGASSLQGLSPGTYTVTVTESNGCTSTASTVVGSPSAIQASVSGISNVSCSGASDGSASISVTGGTAPYTFNWSPGGTNQSSATNLGAGTYTVTVTDANTCIQRVNVNISAPLPLTVTQNNLSNALCNGDNTGSAAVIAQGGTAPYIYNWSPGGFSTSAVSGLNAGNYSVQVTDAQGCNNTLNITINQPLPLQLSVTETNSTCGSSNGSASVTASGGTAPFTYHWSTGAEAPSISGLLAGAYQIDVTDANGCSISDAAAISNIGGPVISVSTVNQLSCYGGSNGSAGINVNSGSPPYSYQWSPSGGNNSTASGLSAGTYTVTVVDGNNCISALSVDISSPPEIQLLLTPTDPGCYSNNTGAILANVTGGTGAYNYSWSNTFSNSPNIYNLPAGNYQLTVTDAAGCTKSATTTLNQPSQLTGSLTNVTPVSCYGENNGSASIQVSGGTGPYEYMWLPTGGNLPVAGGLSDGNYNVTVTDIHNCSITIPVQINQPAPLSATLSMQPVTCAGESNGSVSAAVNGGNGPFTYTWNPAVSTSAIASNLSAGSYDVTITDANGCNVTTSAIVTEPQLLQATVIYVNDVTCNGGNNGSASIAATGGTGNYSYNWMPTGNTSPYSNSLSAGVYTIIVTDSRQCTFSTLVVINEPVAMQDSIGLITHVTCNGGNDGFASVIAFGGTPPFNYLWNPTSANTSSINNLTSGNYQVTISDANGCVATESFIITEPSPLTITSSTTPATCGTPNGSATIGISGGISPYSIFWNSLGNNNSTVTGLGAGSYSVTVSDLNGCTQTASVNVSNISSTSISVNSSPVSCNGGSDGSASVTINTGSPPYQYFWNTLNSNASVVNGLTAGTYTVSVTDGNSCVEVMSVNVTEPSAIAISNASISDVSCHGGNDGSASVNINGGTAPFSILWNHTTNNQPSISSLSAGTYFATVTDALGCTASTQITINEPLPITDSVFSSPAACGVANGSGTIFVNGGIAPYQYSWSPGGMTGSTVSNISAGFYSVTITDSKNCTHAASLSVSNIYGPSISVSSVTPVSCFGGNNGSASVNVFNGTPPFSFQWFPTGGNLSSAVNLSAGNYSVQVEDANHCITSQPVSITSPTSLEAIANGIPATCFGQASGSANVLVNGGTTPYQYLWSNGNQTQNASMLSSGNYSVIVTDANGCTTGSAVTIAQPAAFNFSTIVQDVSCFGLSNGYASVQLSGGNTPYQFTWPSTGANTSWSANLAAGSHDVYFEDANGCRDTATVIVYSPLPLALLTTGTDVKCFGGNDGTAQVSVSGGISPYTYAWDNGLFLQHLTNIPSGNYSVIITDANGCTQSSSLFISQPAPLNVTTVNPPTICIGQEASLSIQVSGGTQPYSYTWNNGFNNSSQNVSPDTTSFFTVNVSDANGCSSSPVMLLVSVYPPLLAMPSIADTLCEGEETTLQVNASGGNGGPYTYLWDNGHSGNSLTVAPGQTTIYHVNVMDHCTVSPVSASVPVVVNPKPVVNFLPNPLLGCAPLNAHFFDQSSFCSSCTYQWEFGDGATSTERNGKHIYTNPGDYTVTHTVTNGFGCTGQLLFPAAVRVFPVPEASFTVSSETVSELNPVVTFFDQSIEASQWQWSFGDGTGTSSEENPSYTYKDTGTYLIRLITVSEYGCMDTTFKKITVRGEYAVYAPNTFTPNGDGVNDFFIPLTLGVKKFEMFIYDRWGLLIYRTNDLQQPWNGKVQGSDQVCQNDVYVYKIDLQDTSGRFHDLIGHVSLIK